MKIFDVFPFFDEIDLLKIRLKTLSPLVDFFVISEFSTSFSGTSKDFFFEKNINDFAEFKDKIIYLKQRQSKIMNPFENDHFQKDSIKKQLEILTESGDIILFGDVDEIPDPQAVVKAVHLINSGTKICHFAQSISYSYLNMVDQSGSLLSYCGEYPSIRNKKWLGTIATTPEHLSGYTMTQLRDPIQKMFGIRLEFGGWHFSYAGGNQSEVINRITNKLKNTSHQEFNNIEILTKVESRLKLKEDILGRNWNKSFLRRSKSQFKIVPINEFFPLEVQLHQEKYRHLIHDYD